MSDAARDALRRYLEQRREQGERELVLDGMSVDDVLGVLGARSRSVDDVQAPADHPRLRAEVEPSERARPISDSESDQSQGVEDVPPSDDAPTDWRAALRAAGAAAPTERPRQPAPPATTPEEPAAEPGSDRGTPEPSTSEATTSDATASGAAAPARKHVDAASAQTTNDAGVPLGLDVGGGTGALFSGPLEHVASLDEIARIVAECTRCPLHRNATHAVPGEGNPEAELVIVGEAPGADEDASGRPFVGASGQLLTKILAAINLQREEVFICNVVKHRPPGNRNPEADEVAACVPYLARQLELLRPKVILTLGNFAAQTLLGTKLGVSKLRGQVHRYHGIPLVATYHPAALLRNPTWKRPTWEDVQLARRILDRAE